MGLYEALEQRIVWERAKHHPMQLVFPSTEWRVDDFGNLIRWSDYGDRNSQYGWELDHIHPSSFGGIDHHINKRALHWRANVGLGGIARALLNPTTAR